MFDKALLINPYSFDAYIKNGITFKFIYKGAALDAIGKFDESIKMYDRAL